MVSWLLTDPINRVICGQRCSEYLKHRESTETCQNRQKSCKNIFLKNYIQKKFPKIYLNVASYSYFQTSKREVIVHDQDH